jgi:hypothetical protein
LGPISITPRAMIRLPLEPPSVRALARHGVSERIRAGGSHFGSTLKPKRAVLTLGIFRRSRSVAYLRADASPDQVHALTIVPTKPPTPSQNRPAAPLGWRAIGSECRWCSMLSVVFFSAVVRRPPRRRRYFPVRTVPAAGRPAEETTFTDTSGDQRPYVNTKIRVRLMATCSGRFLSAHIPNG